MEQAGTHLRKLMLGLLWPPIVVHPVVLVAVVVVMQ